MLEQRSEQGCVVGGEGAGAGIPLRMTQAHPWAIQASCNGAAAPLLAALAEVEIVRRLTGLEVGAVATPSTCGGHPIHVPAAAAGSIPASTAAPGAAARSAPDSPAAAKADRWAAAAGVCVPATHAVLLIS